MANILLIDENEISQRAMKGVLARAGHRLVGVGKTAEAWTKLRELVKFDLIFSEVKISDLNGLSFAAKLRADPFLKNIPIVFYTSVNDHTIIQKALTLHIQNYLVKPYHDDAILAEVAKAMANPWRNLFFEEEKSFCVQMGFCANTLRHMREKVIDEVDKLMTLLPLATSPEHQKAICEQIDTIEGDAEASGIWGLAEWVATLIEKTEINAWAEIRDSEDEMHYARSIIFYQIHPDILPMGFLSDDEKRAAEEAAEKARWMDADVLRHGQVVQAQGVQALVDTITDCPIIESAAANFCMYADGQASHLSRLADLVVKDPGLAAQMLLSVNRIEREGMNLVDDPRIAIGLLGELRLNAISKSLLTIEDRHWQAPPFTWPHYWMYLMGVANVAHYTCEQMEFHLAEPAAFPAGLIHDVGKLLLSRMYPFALPAMLAHSRAQNVSLHVAEQRFIGTTTRDMATRWVETATLSTSLKSVIRWVECPKQATQDQELVAAVSLARMLCQHNHIGFSGDTPKDTCPPIEETEAWAVLRERVFPGFQLAEFEHRVHAHCRNLRNDLLGRLH